MKYARPRGQARRVRWLAVILAGLACVYAVRVVLIGPTLRGAQRYQHSYEEHERTVSRLIENLRHTQDNSSAHRREDAKIPWLIHQSWKSVDKIPARFEPWMRSWRELNPQWQYVFWTDDDNLAIFEHVYPQYLYVAKALSKIALADMARYALLHHFGGLYADADFECVQPFGGLHEEYELFLSSEPRAHTVLLEGSNTPALCNALMASAPGHPFWVHVLESIKTKFDAVRESELSDPVALTGPRIVKNTYYDGFENDTRVTVLPPTYFYPEVAYWNMESLYISCENRNDAAAKEACAWLEQYPDGEFTERTHATHHWQCTWCRKDRGSSYTNLASIFPTSGGEIYRPSFNKSKAPTLDPIVMTFEKPTDDWW